MKSIKKPGGSDMSPSSNDWHQMRPQPDALSALSLERNGMCMSTASDVDKGKISRRAIEASFSSPSPSDSTVRQQAIKSQMHRIKPVNLYDFIDLRSHFYQDIDGTEKELLPPHGGVELTSRT